MGCIICVLHVEHVERITVVLHGKHGECITPVLHGGTWGICDLCITSRICKVYNSCVWETFGIYYMCIACGMCITLITWGMSMDFNKTADC